MGATLRLLLMRRTSATADLPAFANYDPELRDGHQGIYDCNGCARVHTATLTPDRAGEGSVGLQEHLSP